MVYIYIHMYFYFFFILFLKIGMQVNILIFLNSFHFSTIDFFFFLLLNTLQVKKKMRFFPTIFLSFSFAMNLFVHNVECNPQIFLLHGFSTQKHTKLFCKCSSSAFYFLYFIRTFLFLNLVLSSHKRVYLTNFFLHFDELGLAANSTIHPMGVASKSSGTFTEKPNPSPSLKPT